MARGTKNYFRHSVETRRDPKIVTLLENGKEYYFYFFCILELCAEQAANGFPHDGKFTIHPRTLCQNLMVSRSSLVRHLSAIQSSLLLRYSMEENQCELLIPNLAKYMGKYESKIDLNRSNKRKEKEIKEKEIKENKSETQDAKKTYPVVESLAFLDDELLAYAKRMTESQQQKLVDGYGVEVVRNYLLRLASWDMEQPQNKKKKDVFLTCKNWISSAGLKDQVEWKKQQDLYNKKLEEKENQKC